MIKQINKIVNIEVTDSIQGIVSGYITTFGNTDKDGDIILSTAYDNFLVDSINDRLQLFYNHRKHDQVPIGGFFVKDLTKDLKGIFAEIKMDMLQPLAIDVVNAIKAGNLQSFSVGLRVLEQEIKKEDEEIVNILKELQIMEVSVVWKPANPKAQIESLKGTIVDELDAVVREGTIVGVNRAIVCDAFKVDEHGAIVCDVFKPAVFTSLSNELNSLYRKVIMNTAKLDLINLQNFKRSEK